MFQSCHLLFAWFDPFWAIPIVGGTITALAFLIGRRLLQPSRSAEPVQPEAEADRSLGGVTTDRRATFRRKGNEVEVLLADETDAPPRPGWVQDRSMGGLCLLVDEELPQGAVFKVKPRFAPEVTPWTPIIVKTCRPLAGQYELGCQFQQTPSYNVLLLFG